MTQSYASAALAATVSITLDKLRDITGAAVADSYIRNKPSKESLADRIARSTAFRSLNDLPDISAAELALDTANSMARSVFYRIVRATGVESTASQDLQEARGYVVKSHLDGFLARSGTAATSIPTTRTLHLLDDPPIVIADEDSVIADRMREAHKYVRDLVKTV